MGELRLSKTKANAYLSCPHKYYLGYELKLWPLKKSIALVTGLVAHKLIEVYLTRLYENKPFSLEGSHEVAWTQYPQQSTNATDQEYSASMNLTHTLAELFISRVQVNPMMIEHSFDLPVVNLATGQVADGLVWAGIMDHVNCRDDGVMVCDIKTKAKKGAQFDVRTAFELTGYAYAYRMQTEKREAGVILVNLIKTKQPDLQILEDYRDERDFDEFFQTLTAVADGIRANRFYRSQLMLQVQLGLTKTYNQFHNKQLVAINDELPEKEMEKKYGKETLNLLNHLQRTKNTCLFNEAVEGIIELRRLHREMDETVLKAYGWADINLAHDFYEIEYLPENDRIRYTISPAARREILKRLLKLNHEIHEKEVSESQSTLPKKKSHKVKKIRPDSNQIPLF